jgi:acetylornithine deacetylase/succinyl-diaminopimelate desuccinylase-like protein
LAPQEHRLSDAGRRHLLRDLAALVSIPSVSADRRHAGDVHRAAAWLARRLATAGLGDVRLLEAGGPPVVVGRAPASGGRRGRPHVLLYAHYDVQPAGTGWTSPPFRLTVRGPDAVGRGSADDKGPLLAHVVAVEHLLGRGRLPTDVTFVLDGEEEIGSPHLPAVLRALPRPDVVLISDTRMASRQQPALVRSLRGSVTLDLALRTAHPALHAGQWGGAVRGAAGDLAALLAPLGREGAAGDHTVEPAVTITCLRSGGPATAVPDTGSARLNLRTVIGQDPARVATVLERQLRDRLSRGTALDVRRGSAVPAVRADVRGPGARAAAAAYVDAFGRRPVVTPSGGTIAAVAQLRAAFGAPVVLMGFTPPDARIHAPDERMHLPVLWRAVAAAARFHHHLARQ